MEKPSLARDAEKSPTRETNQILSASKKSFNLDSNHLGIRLTVFVVMIAGFFIGLFVLMPALTRALGLQGILQPFLIVGGGLGLGFGTSWAAEWLLKRVWPSGRKLEVSAESITLREPSGENTSLVWDKGISVLSWHFVIRQRRAWVPKGWYCVACRLSDGDNVITAYTFTKPAIARAMPQWTAFEELISQKAARTDYEVRLAASQEHLRAAEDMRWHAGVEMLPEDFATLVQELDRRLADWPPKAR